jgi:hypothetical protein
MKMLFLNLRKDLFVILHELLLPFYVIVGFNSLNFGEILHNDCENELDHIVMPYYYD